MKTVNFGFFDEMLVHIQHHRKSADEKAAIAANISAAYHCKSADEKAAIAANCSAAYLVCDKLFGVNFFHNCHLFGPNACDFSSCKSGACGVVQKK